MEPLHAISYFATECRQANADVGLRGFWMGYFAARAAPMGAVGPGLVAATFYNFHPDMVRRSIPDAWGFADPTAVEAARRASAGVALRRVHPGIETVAHHCAGPLWEVALGADGAGRPLFAANRDLPRPADPVEALWQACTTLREHRGDGHVAVLAAEGLDGCEAHLVFAAANGIPDQILRDNRGWSAEEWRDASHRLAARGLVDDGMLTQGGMALNGHIEARTDELAAPAYARLGEAAVDLLVDTLGEAARAIVHAEVIPFPNPMGVPPPAD
jgi:helix-turn-helix protein